MSRRKDLPPTYRDVLSLMERLQRATEPRRDPAPVPLSVAEIVDFDRNRPKTAGGKQASRHMTANECWVPAGGSAEVGGYDIGGMVYVGEGLRAQIGRKVENCLINPALPVATRIVRDATDAAYSPSYSDLSPSDRLGYLRWLASGRTDPNVAPPFLRLYFFGLERRLMLDDPSKDERAALVGEVERLVGIYGEEYGLDEDMHSLLEHAAALDPESIEPTPERMVEHDGYALPLSVAVGLGHRLANGEQMDGECLLCWWLARPDTRLRVAERRIFAEFSELFVLRYEKRYPKGLKVTVPSGTKDFVYTAASGTFKRPLFSGRTALPDIARIHRPIRIANRIAGECWKDLTPFSRFVGRKPHEREGLMAHVLLPTDLAIHRHNAELQKLHDWAARHVDRPDTELSVEDVLRVFEGKTKVSARKQKLVVLSNALALGGLGIAPDARFTGRLPNLKDPAVLFRLPSKVSRPAEMSPQYLRVLTIMHLVALVANADGSVSKAQWKALDSMVQLRPRLRAADKTRLRADLRWLAEKPLGTVALKRRCATLRPNELDETCEMAVKVACAEGPVSPAQVQAVQKLYQAMGRAQDDVFANLHRRTAKAPTRPITVRKPSQPPRGFSVQRRSGDRIRRVPTPVSLDDGRISKIVADTRKVSQVLSEVFAEAEEAVPTQPESKVDPAKPAVFSGLDAAHCALLASLLRRRSWTESEFARLAASHGLMAGGALETVNEWAFENFGEALLEDDEDLTLNAEILQALRSKSEMVPDAAT